MLTERQLQTMENGASHEVETLCAEVRRLRDGISAIAADVRSDQPDIAADLLLLLFVEAA